LKIVDFRLLFSR